MCLVVASLAACAPMERRIFSPGPPTPCDNSGECQLYVEVMYCGPGGLRITPEHIGVEEAKKIQWRIVTPAYIFPPDGDVASDGIVVNGSGFSRRPGVSGDGKKFVLHDDHSDRGRPIKYSVHVLNQDRSECTRYDPYISNQ